MFYFLVNFHSSYTARGFDKHNYLTLINKDSHPHSNLSITSPTAYVVTPTEY